jgi:hypothetical protein
MSPVLEQKLSTWQADFEKIDWEHEMETNPSLSRALAKVSHTVLARGGDRAKQFAALHREYDEIDWDLEISKSPVLARHLGSASAPVQAFSGNTFSNLSHCTIQICVGSSRDSNEDNKENQATVNSSVT